MRSTTTAITCVLLHFRHHQPEDRTNWTNKTVRTLSQHTDSKATTRTRNGNEWCWSDCELANIVFGESRLKSIALQKGRRHREKRYEAGVQIFIGNTNPKCQTMANVREWLTRLNNDVADGLMIAESMGDNERCESDSLDRRSRYNNRCNEKMQEKGCARMQTIEHIDRAVCRPVGGEWWWRTSTSKHTVRRLKCTRSVASLAASICDKQPTSGNGLQAERFCPSILVMSSQAKHSRTPRTRFKDCAGSVLGLGGYWQFSGWAVVKFTRCFGLSPSAALVRDW